jgi:hypothetical protein
MQTLKQWALAVVGAVALGGPATGVAQAADIPAQPYYRSAPAPQYAPPPVVQAYPPPVVYRYAPPPVVYYNVPAPIVVAPPVVYPRRFVYGYPYRRHFAYRGFAPRVVRGHWRHGRHWRR